MTPAVRSGHKLSHTLGELRIDAILSTQSPTNEAIAKASATTPDSYCPRYRGMPIPGVHSVESRAAVAFRRAKVTSVNFDQIKRGAFAVLSRSAIAIYSRFPIFGYLRAGIAVIRKDSLLLVIERSDKRGISFPGGLAWPWETAEQAMKREILEETGLRVVESSLLCEYRSCAEIPCKLTVFEAQVNGRLRDSWEGSPRWLAGAKIKESLIPSQRQIIDRIC
jgi:NUDIX domain